MGRHTKILQGPQQRLKMVFLSQQPRPSRTSAWRQLDSGTHPGDALENSWCADRQTEWQASEQNTYMESLCRCLWRPQSSHAGPVEGEVSQVTGISCADRPQPSASPARLASMEGQGTQARGHPRGHRSTFSQRSQVAGQPGNALGGMWMEDEGEEAGDPGRAKRAPPVLHLWSSSGSRSCAPTHLHAFACGKPPAPPNVFRMTTEMQRPLSLSPGSSLQWQLQLVTEQDLSGFGRKVSPICPLQSDFQRRRDNRLCPP